MHFYISCVGISRLESKKYETLKHELDDLKKKINSMSSDNHRLKSNLSQFDAKDREQRYEIERLSQQMADSLEKLRSASKEKVMKRKRFNWIIKLRIAGSLINAKLLCVSFSCLALQSNLQAELEAEQQICQTKKRALQIATEELSKNHDTIRQQAKIVEKLKKGIEWRTLVMLRIDDENQGRRSLNVVQC